jgi:hypothetical protein
MVFIDCIYYRQGAWCENSDLPKQKVLGIPMARVCIEREGSNRCSHRISSMTPRPPAPPACKPKNH